MEGRVGTDLRDVKLHEVSAKVRAIRNCGVSLDEIALECGASWWTVLRWMRAERIPHPHHMRCLEAMHAKLLAER